MAARLLQHVLVFGQRHAERIGQFALGRRTTVFLLQHVDGRLDAAHVAAQAARQPVVIAQAIEHGTADPLHGIGFELRAQSVLVAADGIEQPHHAVLDEVVDLDTGRQSGHELVGDPLDQRRIGFDQVGLVEITFGVVHPLSLYLFAARCSPHT